MASHPMKKGGTRKIVNRNKEVKNIQNKATNKQWFRIPPSQKEFPGQLIRLYASTLRNNFPGQQLKEANPKEYLKQKQMLNITQKMKRNRELGLLRRAPVSRGPGSRGSQKPTLIQTKSNFLAWLERMEKE